MKSFRPTIISQKGVLFVLLVLILSFLVLSPNQGGQRGVQTGDQQQGTEVEGSTENTAPPTGVDDGPKVLRERWDYYLSIVIAILTAMGVLALIYYSFSTKHYRGPDEQRVALYVIVVALIIEAVMIAGILGIDSKQYESIYAGIAGYVLGSLGKSDKKRSE